MKIAFTIPIKDVEDFRLKKALECHFYQTRQPDEGFVIDYNSKIINKKIYKSIVASFPTVTFIEVIKDTDVFSAARMHNIAIKQTNSDYLIFTDVDILPSRNAYEVVEDELIKNPQAILMCARRDLPVESHNPDVDFIKDFELWAKKGIYHPGPGSFMCLSVWWLKEVNGFDEFYKGWGTYDVDMQRRAKKDGLIEIWLDTKMNLLHIYHPHPANHYGKGYKNDKRFQKNSYRFYNVEWDIITNKDREWGEI